MTKILGIVAIVAGAAIGAGLSIVALVFTAVGGSGGHIAPLTILFGLVLLASYGYGVRRAWTNFQQGDLFGAGGALLMPPILAYLIMLVGLLAVLMFKTIFS